MEKRVYDMAAVTSKTVAISLNKKKIGIKGFKNYINSLYLIPQGK